MVWFKVDDGFAFHPKAMQAGNNALGLWVRAGAWCAGQLSDGMVPESALSVFGGKKRDADKLVAVGLWEYDATARSYRFHDWGELQPTKNAVLANRRAGAARQEVFRNPALKNAIRDRDGDLCRYCGVTVHWTDRRGELGGTYDHVIPDGPSELGNLVVCCRGCNARKGRRAPEQAGMELTPGVKSELAPDLLVHVPRPDPTRPDPTVPPTEELTEVPKASPRNRRKPESALPDDWVPKPIHFDHAKAGIDVQTEAAAFRSHAQSVDRRLRDWDAGFTMWLIKARPSFNSAPKRSGPTKSESAMHLAAQFEALENQHLEIEAS